MGFAVPSKKVLEIYNQIIEHGYVTNRPMLGIQYYAVSGDSTYSAIAWKNNLPYGSIVIASIATNSSLNETNIKVGDIVTAVNGKKLDDTAILLEAIENAKVGDSFQFMRNGYFTVDKKSTDDKKIFNLTVTLKDSYKPTV